MPSGPLNLAVSDPYLTDNLYGVDIAWSPPASNGGSPISQYLVSVCTSILGVLGQPCYPFVTDGAETYMTITGLSPGVTYVPLVFAANQSGQFSPESSDWVFVEVAVAPVAPTTTLVVSAGMTYWDCNQSYGGDWSCNGDIDKSDFLYEYWTCNESYGGDWSCNGDIDKSDYGYEYWNCDQSYGGDWSCSGDARKAIFTIPVPIAVS